MKFMSTLKHTSLLLYLLAIFFIQESMAQSRESDPVKIIKKANDKLQGLSSKAELKMTIIRPSWTREMKMKAWSKGEDYSLTLITGPARDKGTAFLKRDREIWNWQPNIDRSIKLPPSMMMQSWMGSDLTNDDLVKQFSIVNDYNHTLLGIETIENRECYHLQLIPKEEAAVIWGKILIWIDVEEYMQMKTEFYDEDGYLINTMEGTNVKMLGGKLLPAKMIVTPEEEEGQKTILEYIAIDFDVPIKDNFFSVQNMKRVK